MSWGIFSRNSLKQWLTGHSPPEHMGVEWGFTESRSYGPSRLQKLLDSLQQHVLLLFVCLRWSLPKWFLLTKLVLPVSAGSERLYGRWLKCTSHRKHNWVTSRFLLLLYFPFLLAHSVEDALLSVMSVEVWFEGAWRVGFLREPNSQLCAAEWTQLFSSAPEPLWVSH